VEDGQFTAIIEIPKGSRNKYEYDHETHAIKLDRFLYSSVVYPTDYGFIPDTLSLDGDPLDVMVCVSEPTFPGCQIDVKPIALFRMEDDQGIDDKVLAVPCSDPTWNKLQQLEDLSKQLQNEIAHFFSVYKDLEQKRVKVRGWFSREDAIKEIDASRERYAQAQGDAAIPAGSRSAKDGEHPRERDEARRQAREMGDPLADASPAQSGDE
jgi:inorganic pyrophosphatase